jgi:hypothetical protein
MAIDSEKIKKLERANSLLLEAMNDLSTAIESFRADREHEGSGRLEEAKDEIEGALSRILNFF